MAAQSERLAVLLPEGPLADERQAAAALRLRNVPRPTPEFTGRNVELMRIHGRLHSRALERLLRASLLTRRRGREQAGEPVEIHPLVADTALWLLAVPTGEFAEALGTHLLGLVDAADDIRAHDQALADAMRQAAHFALRLESETGVALGGWLGRYHSARGNYLLAREAEEQALALARRALSERHSDTLRSMNNLARRFVPWAI